jgi:hypothetical protein
MSYFVFVFIYAYWCPTMFVSYNRNTTGATIRAGSISLPEHLSAPVDLIGVRGAQSLVFCVEYCTSLLVFLSFFYWPLHCLSFFDLLIVSLSLTCIMCIENLYKCTTVKPRICSTCRKYLSFFFWPLYCLSYFDLLIVILSITWIMCLLAWLIVFNTTSNNISAISWRSALLVYPEKTNDLS